jgi:hypothetical protein
MGTYICCIAQETEQEQPPVMWDTCPSERSFATTIPCAPQQKIEALFK